LCIVLRNILFVFIVGSAIGCRLLNANFLYIQQMAKGFDLR